MGAHLQAVDPGGLVGHIAHIVVAQVPHNDDGCNSCRGRARGILVRGMRPPEPVKSPIAKSSWPLKPPEGRPVGQAPLDK